uniref:Apple domain-containing protein n=1 Tax=Steinernema glaseri TaxID=37863 RepID=A0A1I7ZAG3_9BILA
MFSDAQMAEPQNNFFYVVTRRGYVRVKMGGRTLKQINDIIDGVLEEEGGCPDFPGRKSPRFDNAVSYWLNNVGLWSFKSVFGTAKVERICEPTSWVYNLDGEWFTYVRSTEGGQPYTEPQTRRGGDQINCKTPCVFTSCSYNRQVLRSCRDASNTEQCCCVFQRRDLSAIMRYKDGRSDEGKFCLLREYTHEMDELPETQMMPLFKKESDIMLATTTTTSSSATTQKILTTPEATERPDEVIPTVGEEAWTFPRDADEPAKMRTFGERTNGEEREATTNYSASIIRYLFLVCCLAMLFM